MKSTFLLLITLSLVAGCGARDSIKGKYLYSDKIKEVLTDEEYYRLDKEAKWPSNNYGPMCSKTGDNVNFDVDIKESLLKK
mgnify:CR=1 FL=1